MLTNIFSTTNVLTIIVSSVVFIILFSVIFKAVFKNLFEQKFTAAAVSLCVTLLSIIGMHRMLLGGKDQGNTAGVGNGPGIDFLLVPYAALGFTILLTLLLLFLLKLVNHNPEIHQHLSKDQSPENISIFKMRKLLQEKKFRKGNTDLKHAAHSNTIRRCQALWRKYRLSR